MHISENSCKPKSPKLDLVRAGERLTRAHATRVNDAMGQRIVMAPSFISRLRLIKDNGPISGQGGSGSTSKASRSSFHLPAADLLNAIRKDALVEAARLTPDAVPLLHRSEESAVEALVAAAMGHDDETMAAVLSMLRGWISAVMAMTEPADFLEVLGACPECEARYTMEFTDAGEFKKVPAMVVASRTNDKPYAACRACSSVWHEGQLLELAAYFLGITVHDLIVKLSANHSLAELLQFQSTAHATERAAA
jgi:hypothetical protein